MLRTILTVCGLAGAVGLRADGEVYLKNALGEPIIIHRLSTFLGGLAGNLQGRIRPGDGSPGGRDTAFFPIDQASVLVVQPGETAELGWKEGVLRSRTAHLHIQVGAGDQRCVLGYTTQILGGTAAGRLAPCRDCGPLAELVEDRGTAPFTQVLAGIREREGTVHVERKDPQGWLPPGDGSDPHRLPEACGEPRWLRPKAHPGVFGPELRTRRLADRIQPKASGLLAWLARPDPGPAAASGPQATREIVETGASVYLACRSRRDLFLRLHSVQQGGAGSALSLHIADDAKDSVRPAGKEVRLRRAETAIIGLSGKAPARFEATFALEMEGDDRVCFLRYTAGEGRPALLEPCRPCDREWVDDPGGSDTLVVEGFHTPAKGL
jgi:hypothetical protein